MLIESRRTAIIATTTTIGAWRSIVESVVVIVMLRMLRVIGMIVMVVAVKCAVSVVVIAGVLATTATAASVRVAPVGERVEERVESRV